MKYCTKCGNELLDEAVICPKCGCSQEEPKQELASLPTIALVFACLGGWIGLILSIVGMCMYKEPGANRHRCKTALIISICWIVLFVVIMISAVACTAALM